MMRVFELPAVAIETADDYLSWTLWKGDRSELEAGLDLALTYGHWGYINDFRMALGQPPHRSYGASDEDIATWREVQQI